MENHSHKPRILIVDDDREIRSLLSQFLQKHDYQVSVAADGHQMWEVLKNQPIDIIVLDLMMPGDDGLTLCRQLRNDNNQYYAIPIIMLTALGEDTDRIVGLELGADDYLPKPFNQRELLARIKAILRRVPSSTTNSIPHQITSLGFEGWTLNVTKRELYRADQVLVPLTAGEYELLVAFLEHPQQVLNRDQLLDLTKGRTLMPFDRSIDVQISRLRRKIEKDSKNPSIIKTVRSGGYIFTASVEQH